MRDPFLVAFSVRKTFFGKCFTMIKKRNKNGSLDSKLEIEDNETEANPLSENLPSNAETSGWNLAELLGPGININFSEGEK